MNNLEYKINIIRQRIQYELPIKIRMTEKRIQEWYNNYNGNVFVSFSGGKDSTVLLDIVRSLYPHIPAVFVDTGLEYPEIKDFVRTINNVIWLKPKMNFKHVIDKYGYPIISKANACAISRYRNTKSDIQRYRRLNGWPNGKKGMIPKKWQYLIEAPYKISDRCCDILKKNPIKDFIKKSGKFPMTGMMAIESNQRLLQYAKQGCNAFNLNSPLSWPIAFWTEYNIWEYIELKNIPYCNIYNMGVKRTGCMFCLFGIQYNPEKNRITCMNKTPPSYYKHIINNLKFDTVIDFINSGIKNKILY